MELLYKIRQIDGSIDIMAVKEINVVFTDESGLPILSHSFNYTETLDYVTNHFFKAKKLQPEDHVLSCERYKLEKFKTLRQIVGDGNLLIVRVELVERGVRVYNEYKRREEEDEAKKFCNYVAESLQRYNTKTKATKLLLRGLKTQVKRLQTKVKDREENQKILKLSLTDAEKHLKAKGLRVGSVLMTDFEEKVAKRQKLIQELGLASEGSEPEDDVEEQSEDGAGETGLSDYSEDEKPEDQKDVFGESDSEEDGEPTKTGLSDSEEEHVSLCQKDVFGEDSEDEEPESDV